MKTRSVLRSLVLAAALSLGPLSALAQDKSGIAFELNGAKTVASACRVTFVVRNTLDAGLTALALDLVVFDKDESVTGYAGIDIGALPKGKTRVRQYEVADYDCEKISRLLINEVRACDNPAGKIENCATLLKLRTKTTIDLTL